MTSDLQGLLMCGRYSFAPNSLHYCGPERQNDMMEYVVSGVVDGGLVELLNRFDTLYNYLVLIAHENNIADPFDRRVVEAYWLGNSLLGNVQVKALAAHLTDTLDLKRKLTKKKLHGVMNTSVSGGIPLHNFHVLNIFMRTGHDAVPHTLSTMDQCRISWGKVINPESRDKPLETRDTVNSVIVETQSLVYEKYNLILSIPQNKIVKSIVIRPKVGEWVSLHWGHVCDVLTDRQRTSLERYTDHALVMANRTTPRII